MSPAEVIGALLLDSGPIPIYLAAFNPVAG